MRGSSIILFVIFTGVLTTNFILRAFDDPAGFKTVTAFTLMYIVGFVPLVFMLLRGVEPIPWFQNLNRDGLKHVGVGVLGLVASGWVSANLFPYPASAYLAAFASGLILFYLLLETGSILVPITVHGTFNSIVVLQDVFTEYLSWIRASIFVPSLGVTVSDLSAKASEVILQYTFVAPAEEFLKVALASALMLQTTLPLLREKWAAIGVAVTVWISWHAYLAYV